MATYRFDRSTGQVERADVVRARHAAPRRRSPLPAPMVLSDACEFRSMADGQTYTSKAAYRADLRARGLVEVGNDSCLTRQRQDVEFTPDAGAEAALFEQHVGA